MVLYSGRLVLTAGSVCCAYVLPRTMRLSYMILPYGTAPVLKKRTKKNIQSSYQKLWKTKKEKKLYLLLSPVYTSSSCVCEFCCHCCFRSASFTVNVLQELNTFHSSFQLTQIFDVNICNCIAFAGSMNQQTLAINLIIHMTCLHHSCQHY